MELEAMMVLSWNSGHQAEETAGKDIPLQELVCNTLEDVGIAKTP
jgi:hypothetical protein